MFDRIRRWLQRKPKPDLPGLPGLQPPEARHRKGRDPHDPLHYRSGSPAERWLRGDDLVDRDQDEEDDQ